MQTYSAYTKDLDDRNAEAYRDPARGPDRVLRQTAAIDSRFVGWESPRAAREMFCRFTEAVRVGQWQVLQRGRNRCGSPRDLGAVVTRTAKTVTVPAARRNEMVVAFIEGAEVKGLERVSTALLRAKARRVAGPGRLIRVVPGTLGNGLIVSVPIAYDYQPPFQMAPGIPSIRVTIGDAGHEADVPLRIRWRAYPLLARTPAVDGGAPVPIYPAR